MTLTAAYRTRALPGQDENGDGAFVRELSDGAILFGVIDALGHGHAAAATTKKAMTHLHDVDVSAGITAVMMSLHRALRGSRGAAALIGIYRAGVVSACAVGNVELRRRGVRLPLHLTPGVVGGTLSRPPMAAVAEMPKGARLVLFSDGVSGKFGDDDINGSVDDCAHTLMERYARDTDDATVLVVEAC